MPDTVKPSIAYVVLDSCRVDSFASAKRPVMDSLGQWEVRHALGSWTAPAMFLAFQGFIPYTRHSVGTLNVPEIGLVGGNMNGLTLPGALRNCGYETWYFGSFGPMWFCRSLQADFDHYESVQWFEDQIAAVKPRHPQFVVFHCFETHMPYIRKGHRSATWDRLWGDVTGRSDIFKESSWTEEHKRDMPVMHKRQQAMIEHIDGLLPRLLEKLPRPLRLLIFADHGELFGEHGLFGHVYNFDPVLYVPYLEASLKA